MCMPGTCNAQNELLTIWYLDREDVVILDMEAGLEHLGRGTTEGVWTHLS